MVTILMRDGRVFEAQDADVGPQAIQAVARQRIRRGQRGTGNYTYTQPRRHLWPLARIAEIVWDEEAA